MNAMTKLERVRDLAKSAMLATQPLAGEEMDLSQTDAHHDGFVDGERTLAAKILELIDEKDENETHAGLDPAENEMIMDLGRT